MDQLQETEEIVKHQFSVQSPDIFHKKGGSKQKKV